MRVARAAADARLGGQEDGRRRRRHEDFAETALSQGEAALILGQESQQAINALTARVGSLEEAVQQLQASEARYDEAAEISPARTPSWLREALQRQQGEQALLDEGRGHGLELVALWHDKGTDQGEQ